MIVRMVMRSPATAVLASVASPRIVGGGGDGDATANDNKTVTPNPTRCVVI